MLEKDLLALDADDKENRKLALQSRRHDEEDDDDPEYSRKALMKKIDDKLKEYGKQIAPTYPFKKKNFNLSFSLSLRLSLPSITKNIR